MPRRNSPTYTWNATASRYVDRRGRFVSWDAVRGALDATVGKNSARMRFLADALRTGQVSLEEWRLEMRRALKDTHLYSAMAARGGRAQMTQSDYGRVGAEVRFQYKRLEMFAAGIANGSVTLDGRFLARVELYAQSGRSTYERTREREEGEHNGMDEYRNVLHPADHCEECVAATRAGWQPIGTLPPIGQRTCLGNCHCTWKFRKRASGPARRRRFSAREGELPQSLVDARRASIEAAAAKFRERTSGRRASPAVDAARALMVAKQARLKQTKAAAKAKAFTRDATHPDLESVRMAQENGIRANPKESAYAWDAAGNLLLAKDGTKNAVVFTADESALVANAEVFTHNHPGGSTFSADDLRFAESSTIKRFRAVSAEYDYELLRNLAGPTVTPFLRSRFLREARRIYSRAETERELSARLPNWEQADKETIAKVWHEILHERVERFVVEDGRFSYTRRLRK